MTTEQAVMKSKLPKPLNIGIEKYQYLQQIWKQEQLSLLEDFLRCNNNKLFVPPLEANQKLIAFYYDKDINWL